MTSFGDSARSAVYYQAGTSLATSPEDASRGVIHQSIINTPSNAIIFLKAVVLSFFLQSNYSSQICFYSLIDSFTRVHRPPINVTKETGVKSRFLGRAILYFVRA
jgi:hypothetical protein